MALQKLRLHVCSSINSDQYTSHETRTSLALFETRTLCPSNKLGPCFHEEKFGPADMNILGPILIQLKLGLMEPL